MTEYNELKEQIQSKMEALKSEMKQIGQDFFKSETAKLFADYPDLVSFSWTQYTPYFNDGDECVFSVHDYYKLLFRGEDPDEVDEYDEEGIDMWSLNWHLNNADKSDYDVTRGGKISLDLVQRIDAVVAGMDEDVMKALFGDHVSVTVYADRVETELYDHD